MYCRYFAEVCSSSYLCKWLSYISYILCVPFFMLPGSIIANMFVEAPILCSGKYYTVIHWADWTDLSVLCSCRPGVTFLRMPPRSLSSWFSSWWQNTLTMHSNLAYKVTGTVAIVLNTNSYPKNKLTPVSLELYYEMLTLIWKKMFAYWSTKHSMYFCVILSRVLVITSLVELITVL